MRVDTESRLRVEIVLGQGWIRVWPNCNIRVLSGSQEPGARDVDVDVGLGTRHNISLECQHLRHVHLGAIFGNGSPRMQAQIDVVKILDTRFLIS